MTEPELLPNIESPEDLRKLRSIISSFAAAPELNPSALNLDRTRSSSEPVKTDIAARGASLAPSR